jgi:hypothetical protein
MEVVRNTAGTGLASFQYVARQLAHIRGGARLDVSQGLICRPFGQFPGFTGACVWITVAKPSPTGNQFVQRL